MDSKIITITVIVLIIIFIIFIWKREKEHIRRKTANSKILKVDKYSKYYNKNGNNLHSKYLKPDVKATFEREGFAQNYKFEVKSTGLKGIKLPENFSAIKRWNGMITGVYDQEKCGSCWAFSTCSSLTDRIRIKSDGKFLQDGDYISPFQLAACMKCGVGKTCADVCEGNYLDDVLEFLVKSGSIAQSDIDKHHGEVEEYMCFDSQKFNVKPWKGTHKYRVNMFPPGMLNTDKNLSLNETAIMEEIYEKGPVCCIIKVYVPMDSKNFYNYRSGVYGHGWETEPDETDGYHAINIVGWGEEIKDGEKVKYWIVRNSWGDDWGTSGFGKILRGSNFGMIESDIWAIEPDLNGH